MEKQILLFDGVCNLCNSIVKFTIKRDPAGQFHFASLQSQVGQNLLRQYNLPTDDMDSFVLIVGDKHYTQSSAGLEVFRRFGGLWSLLYPLILIPKPIRDRVYRFIATNRYQWFGKQDTCLVPTPDIQARFL